MRGKADWIVRGLPTQPPAPPGERLRALPYFLNNLAPVLRNAWIRISRRATVGDLMRPVSICLRPEDSVSLLAENQSSPAVVLNNDGVLLGVIDMNCEGRRAADVMDPACQTIRPDMTRWLASRLMRGKPYLMVTTATGHYLGVYRPEDS